MKRGLRLAFAIGRTLIPMAPEVAAMGGDLRYSPGSPLRFFGFSARAGPVP
jgi:hypothetical protein